MESLQSERERFLHPFVHAKRHQLVVKRLTSYLKLLLLPEVNMKNAFSLWTKKSLTQLLNAVCSAKLLKFANRSFRTHSGSRSWPKKREWGTDEVVQQIDTNLDNVRAEADEGGAFLHLTKGKLILLNFTSLAFYHHHQHHLPLMSALLLFKGRLYSDF